MAVRGNNVVSRVHLKPADSGAVSGDPGVRGIGAHQPWLPRRRISAEISADIARGEVQGAETGDLHVREVLAYTSAFPKYLFGRRPHGGDFCIEAEVTVDARGQVDQRLGHWPPR